jgi:DNA-binding NarL/FixJ family response regulator
MSPVMLLSADNELVRILKRALRETSAKITVEAKTPAAAADALAKSPVALIVVDLFLPESSGLEALKLLKRVNESCVMILLTRMRTRNVLERAFRLGAQDVLQYPVSAEILRDTILHRLAAQPLAEGDEPVELEKKAGKKK